MKMFILIFREYMSDEIHDILHETGVKAYSEIPKVFGLGESGKLDDSRHSPGHNNCIFAVMPEKEADLLSRAFQDYNERNKSIFGRPAALRAFVIPCEHVV